ncbi:DUF4386 domain-containing protein [Cellulomonas fengjieae]|uniref:DUF4386 domain-containing protein n=1 Tax=Cellulomonas fengjieae TaxID=2819978 RepID=A0ABS3SFS7_9CELL|nr:DUF4386 domain-containing protein [Cellulomonas fengjieae]MBO3084611.1 DUF4386 domain-containing protein [Cellulomonas fengjieae]QVI67061.1 DUF4386 domain-containing protein [Cellulomonas fengjieae]
MLTHRTTARTVGTLFIVAAVTAVIGLLAYAPVLDDPDYVLGATTHRTQVAAGALLELVCALSLIGIAVLMFPIVRRRSESAALGYAAFRLLESAVIVVGIISVLAIVTLNESVGADQSHLTASALLVAVHDWTFLFGPNFALAPSTFLMGWFLYRTRLVPRAIAVLGLVAAPLLFASAALVLFGVYDQVSVWGGLTALPVFAYEMSLAVWLLVKGFQPVATARLLDTPAPVTPVLVR